MRLNPRMKAVAWIGGRVCIHQSTHDRWSRKRKNNIRKRSSLPPRPFEYALAGSSKRILHRFGKKKKKAGLRSCPLFGDFWEAELLRVRKYFSTNLNPKAPMNKSNSPWVVDASKSIEIMGIVGLPSKDTIALPSVLSFLPLSLSLSLSVCLYAEGHPPTLRSDRCRRLYCHHKAEEAGWISNRGKKML